MAVRHVLNEVSTNSQYLRVKGEDGSLLDGNYIITTSHHVCIAKWLIEV